MSINGTVLPTTKIHDVSITTGVAIDMPFAQVVCDNSGHRMFQFNVEIREGEWASVSHATLFRRDLELMLELRTFGQPVRFDAYGCPLQTYAEQDTNYVVAIARKMLECGLIGQDAEGSWRYLERWKR